MADGIRIISHPLAASIDGTLLDRAHLDFAQFFIDPLQFNAKGIKEAAEYANPSAVGYYLDSVILPNGGTDPQFKAERVFQTPQGKSFWRSLVSGDNAMETGLEDTASPKGKIFIYSSANISRFSDKPLELFDIISEQRGHTRASRAFAARCKKDIMRIHFAVDRLPEPLRTLIKHEKVTLGVIDPLSLPDNDRNLGCADYGKSFIGLSDELLKDQTRLLDTVLREEVRHYLDSKIRFTKIEHYRHAADRLLADSARMDAIEEMAKHSINGKTGTKKTVRQYPRKSQYAELLVEYYYIQDYLRELYNVGFTGKVGKLSDLNEQKIDEKLKSLFGNEFHQICKAFDKWLGDIAVNIDPTSSRSQTGAPITR